MATQVGFQVPNLGGFAYWPSEHIVLDLNGDGRDDIIYAYTYASETPQNLPLRRHPRQHGE